jgi:NAD(P)-dependent dehydrogenase (short-subunit alcohol dehydrogenase family)
MANERGANQDRITHDLFSVAGKTVLVTGGSSGIGAMIARGFVEAGATVYIASRRKEPVEAAAKELSAYGTCHAIQADVSSEAGALALADALVTRAGRLDVLVNNAGTAWGAPLADYPDAAFDKLWAVNVKAVFNLTKFLLPTLEQHASVNEPARIINIGSVDGLMVPITETYAYSTTKAAVHMLTRHIAHYVVGRHVNVNAIAPGLFPSRMTSVWVDDPDQKSGILDKIPMHRTGRPADIAGLAIFLASRASAFMTGAVVPLDGGISTHG